MFRSGGGGFCRLPMTDKPFELLIAVLILAPLAWLAYRLVTS